MANSVGGHGFRQADKSAGRKPTGNWNAHRDARQRAGGRRRPLIHCLLFVPAVAPGFYLEDHRRGHEGSVSQPGQVGHNARVEANLQQLQTVIVIVPVLAFEGIVKDRNTHVDGINSVWTVSEFRSTQTFNTMVRSCAVTL